MPASPPPHYESLGRGRGEVWRGEGDPSEEGCSPPLPELHPFLKNGAASRSLSNKKAYGAATAREGIPAASVLRFLPKGKACPQYAGPPRKGAFRKPFIGHSQDTRKAPGMFRGLFLLRALSIKRYRIHLSSHSACNEANHLFPMALS